MLCGARQQRAYDIMGICFVERCMLRKQAVPHGPVDQIGHHLDIGISWQFAAPEPLMQDREERLASHSNELCAK